MVLGMWRTKIMNHQNHNYLGDKTKFENRGMDEPDELLYVCRKCHYEQWVQVKFDRGEHRFYPIDIIDTICPQCHDMFMEKA